ncbi:MAG: hypothetical protein ACTSO6_15415 [Promethearchaeota archaeon]
MTENDLNKIRLKKAEMLLKTQSMPTFRKTTEGALSRIYFCKNKC